uniref:Uncharacterized protein n=1 Tax=Roseihalotalea indica TaxID=2867963 RepID=A0AA49GT00_9BACT|nr:hypothetical protein K4G66_06370 [Tunicatimonas sp. TK19036]
MNFTTNEEEVDFEKCLKNGDKIILAFTTALIEIVQLLHAANVSNLPIIIHELEYYAVVSEQNDKANGTERVQEFIDWISQMNNEDEAY